MSQCQSQEKKENGSELTDEQLVPFNDFSSSKSSIDSYKIKAELLLQGFVDNVLDEELRNNKEQAIKQQAKILKDVIQPLVTPFWRNVLVGIIASFLFALIVAAFLFISTFGKYNITIVPK